ncbi:MAG TPA: glycosyltransferase [Chitinophagales bacterium]|nr:glycosyltransferase [Chitinophagales bacterium]
MRPKVLFITRWYPNRVDKLDGNFIENHARAVAMFCDLAILHVCADPSMSDKVFDWEMKQEFGFTVVNVWYRNNDVSKRGLGRVRKFFRYLKATRIGWRLIRESFGLPEVNHVHIFTRPAMPAFYLKWRHRIPFIITEHSSHFVYDLPVLFPPLKWFTQFTARSARYVTVVSKTLQRAMEDFGFHGNYTIVPNVVFVSGDGVMKSSDSVIRIVAIGGLTDARKNIAGLIEVFARAQLPRAQLHIVRPVPDSLLQAKAEESGLLNQTIFFHENLSNDAVYSLLNDCSFLVVNSLSETFSMAAAEALACGKPVVSTRCGGPEEFINDERGKLIDANDPDQLCKALVWMCDHYREFDPKKLKAFVRENYSSEVVGKKFLQLYEDVLNH